MHKHFIRFGYLCRTLVSANYEHEDQGRDVIASILFIDIAACSILF